MRVGLSAYLLHAGADYRAAGVSLYTQQLLSHLPTAGPGHTFIAFHGRDAPPLPGVASVVSAWPTQHPLFRIPWEQLALPLQAAHAGVDLLHGTVNVAPELSPCPTLVTVHDLSFLRYPERFPRPKALYLRFEVARSVRRAARVIAVSSHTKRDLIELQGVEPDKITVVHSGVGEQFHLLPEELREQFRKTTLDGRPYILHVGTLQPRKNIDVLIRAFAQLRRRHDYPHVLALVGARGWMFEGLYQLVRELAVTDSVYFSNYVDAKYLPLWYNGADLFAYPSAYEGFGLPLLEAMACGVPVITSASSALEEIAGTACQIVEPGSQEALEVAMARVLDDADLRRSMRQAGLERASQFSWEQTARATVQVYEQVMGSP